MYVVGVAALARAMDEEIAGLAPDLGLSAYDLRQMVAPGLPAIVMITSDGTHAQDVLARIRGRGNTALIFDADVVTSSGEMVSSRRFHLEADALIADDPPERRLPLADISVFLRAAHRASIEAVTTQTKKQFSMSRAIVTGGLVMRKKVETSSTVRSEERTEVLYCFRRSGETPWLLRERGSHFGGLAVGVEPTERAGFAAMVDLLRTRVPGARFDDRLVGRRVPDRISQYASQSSKGGRRSESSSEAGMDMLAHLLALWLAAGGS